MPTITLTLPVAGTNITAGLHSNNYTTLQSLLNGSLDNNNIAAAAGIAWSKLSPKLSYSALSGGPPAAPADGDIWIATGVDANGTRWAFQYNAGSASASKWEFFGGGDFEAEATSTPTTASIATWTDAGCSLTLARAGDYVAMGTANAVSPATGAAQIQLGISVAAAAPVSPVGVAYVAAASQIQSTSVSKRLSGITAGQAVTLQFQTSVANGGVGNRSLIIRPVRIA